MGPSLPPSPPPGSRHPDAYPDHVAVGTQIPEPDHPGPAGYQEGRRERDAPGSSGVHDVVGVVVDALRGHARIVVAVAAGLVVGLAALAYVWVRDGPAGAGDRDTGLRAGELAAPPRACAMVTAPTLRRLVPGTPATAAPEVATDRSRCTWRVETGGRLRLLDVEVRVFSPSPALGRSASAVAGVEFDADRPPGRIGPPGDRSTVRALGGLGTRAYAVRTSRTRQGVIGNVAGVVVLERNVIVTIRYDGTDGSGARPVSLGLDRLEAGALGAARDVVAALS